MDVLVGNAGPAQRVDLVIRVLVAGRDAGVADQHVSTISDGEVIRRSFSTRVFNILDLDKRFHAQPCRETKVFRHNQRWWLPSRPQPPPPPGRRPLPRGSTDHRRALSHIRPIFPEYYGYPLVLRIPAIVATVAAVVVVALIARELGGDRRGARRARAVRLGADVQQRRRGTDRREHRGRVRGSVGAQPNRAYGYFPLPDESSTDVLFTGADPFDLEPYFTEIREVRGPVSDDIDARVWLLTGRTTGWHEIRQQIRTLDVA